VLTQDRFVLVDWERRDAFAFLGAACRPFARPRLSVDAAGIAWSWVANGGSAFGFTSLGPGRVWAEGGVEPADLVSRIAAMKGKDALAHRVALRRASSELRLGGHAGRLLWCLHTIALAQKTSLMTIADERLGAAVWGFDRSTWPRHWRRVLAQTLRGLTWLHLADAPAEGASPEFGADTVLITHAGDLNGSPEDRCEAGCDDLFASRHHHFQVEIGPGFLGVLEQFATPADESGARNYIFPVTGRGPRPSLRAVGKTGRLVNVFLPAVLGTPALCGLWSSGQHRIVQALVRETTRGESPKEPSTAGRVEGRRILSYSRSSSVVCEWLPTGVPVVGFNGNGFRRGRGYRLFGPGGWPARAGYSMDDAVDFVDDLVGLTAGLGLFVVGVGPGSELITGRDLRGMVGSAAGRRALARVDVRIYARGDFPTVWSEYFGWEEHSTAASGRTDLASLMLAMRTRKITLRSLAKRIDRDPSFLSKLMSGKKPWPPGLFEQATAAVAGKGSRNNCAHGGAA